MHIVYPAVVSALLFSIGVYGVLVRRNTILVLMSVELMLNAVNLNLVAFDVWLADRLHSGQVLTLFVIVIAAAEVGLGLAIVLALYRNRHTVDIDHLRDLAEPTDDPTGSLAIAGTPNDPADDAAHSATPPVRGHAIAPEHTPAPTTPDPAASNLASSDPIPSANAESGPFGSANAESGLTESAAVESAAVESGPTESATAKSTSVESDPAPPNPAESDPTRPANTVEPTKGRPPTPAEPNEHRHSQSAQPPQEASDHSDGTSEADRTGQAETEGGRGGEHPVKRGGTL